MNHQGLTVQEATKKIEYYCAYQERCHKEVVEKLKTLGMFQTAIDHILTHLIEHNYLNEERFARSFARGKHTMSGWGKKRIEIELKIRDISAYNIKAALKELPDDSYNENFEKACEKKWNSINDANVQNKKRKFISYFLRKGYESDKIYKQVQILEKNNN